MRIRSSREARWIGSDISAWAISRPCASAMAVEWSWRSLMLVEKALFWMVIHELVVDRLEPVPDDLQRDGIERGGVRAHAIDLDQQAAAVVDREAAARRHQRGGIELRDDQRPLEHRSRRQRAALDEPRVGRLVGGEPYRAVWRSQVERGPRLLWIAGVPASGVRAPCARSSRTLMISMAAAGSWWPYLR